MAELSLLDQAFASIMQSMVKAGQAPHYTELASDLGLPMEEGRQLLHDLMQTGIPAWLHPDTDYIVSFPPFHNLPTQYRISVDGAQKWFAQCGLEALAVRWLFPGKTVQIDAPCLDCGEPIKVQMRDEQILAEEPKGIVAYTYSQVGGPPENRAWR
ncbi:MAG: organomercurial lyase [Dehalococcoidia bacterium]